MSEAELVRARADAAAAKERMLRSVHTLQARLKPSVLASDAWDSARDAGEAAANNAARMAARRPVATSVAAVGIAAFLARKPIARLVTRLRGKDQ